MILLTRFSVLCISRKSVAIMSKLYVAMYRSVIDNYEHWALYLENNSKHIIYEVIDEYSHFKLNVIPDKSTFTNRHRRSIFVYDVNAIDISDFKNAISFMKFNNFIFHWNCQDYVIESLNKLEKKCVIDEDEKAYISAKKQVKTHFESLWVISIETKHVCRYDYWQDCLWLELNESIIVLFSYEQLSSFLSFI